MPLLRTRWSFGGGGGDGTDATARSLAQEAFSGTLAATVGGRLAQPLANRVVTTFDAYDYGARGNTDLVTAWYTGGTRADEVNGGAGYANAAALSAALNFTVDDTDTIDYAAVQAAVEAAKTAGYGEVRIPMGVYRITRPINVEGANVAFRGADQRQTELRVWGSATRSGGEYRLIYASEGAPAGDIGIFDLTISGYLDRDPTQATGTTQPHIIVFLDAGRTFWAERTTFRNGRFFGVSLRRFDKVDIHGCEIRNMMRDALRILGCGVVQVADNFFRSICDDAIAAHNMPEDQFHSGIYRHNRFVDCQGITSLGARLTIIEGNIFFWAQNRAIQVGMGYGLYSTEGGRQLENVIIKDNQILDVARPGWFKIQSTASDLGSLGYAIRIKFPTPMASENWDAGFPLPNRNNLTGDALTVGVAHSSRCIIEGNVIGLHAPFDQPNNEWLTGKSTDVPTRKLLPYGSMCNVPGTDAGYEDWMKHDRRTGLIKSVTTDPTYVNADFAGITGDAYFSDPANYRIVESDLNEVGQRLPVTVSESLSDFQGIKLLGPCYDLQVRNNIVSTGALPFQWLMNNEVPNNGTPAAIVRASAVIEGNTWQHCNTTRTEFVMLSGADFPATVMYRNNRHDLDPWFSRVINTSNIRNHGAWATTDAPAITLDTFDGGAAPSKLTFVISGCEFRRCKRPLRRAAGVSIAGLAPSVAYIDRVIDHADIDDEAAPTTPPSDNGGVGIPGAALWSDPVPPWLRLVTQRADAMVLPLDEPTGREAWLADNLSTAPNSGAEANAYFFWAGEQIERANGVVYVCTAQGWGGSGGGRLPLATWTVVTPAAV